MTVTLSGFSSDLAAPGSIGTLGDVDCVSEKNDMDCDAAVKPR